VSNVPSFPCQHGIFQDFGPTPMMREMTVALNFDGF
jgi:hypothetical protein